MGPPKKIQEWAQRKCWRACSYVQWLRCGYPTAEEMAPVTPTENVGGITIARGWTWLKWVITWGSTLQRMHWVTEGGGRFEKKGQDRKEMTKSGSKEQPLNRQFLCYNDSRNTEANPRRGWGRNLRRRFNSKLDIVLNRAMEIPLSWTKSTQN